MIITPPLEALCRAQGTESPEMAIRGACISLLAGCGLSDPPIPLKPLCSKLGVSFGWSKGNRGNRLNGQGSAALISDGATLKIAVDEEDFLTRWRRVRFSIAHELVHVLIMRILRSPDLIAALDASKSAHKSLEDLCNLGAAEILMPSATTRLFLSRGILEPSGLRKLYDNFLVSRSLVIQRVADLLPNGSVIRWRRYARKPQEQRCMRVVSSYPYASESRCRWLPSGCTTRHISPTIVEQVAERREPIAQESLTISLGRQRSKCTAFATFFPSLARDDHPIFEGFVVPDESHSPDKTEVVLFTADRNAGFGKIPW